jgi:lysophospholipase L1-like esterase
MPSRSVLFALCLLLAALPLAARQPPPAVAGTPGLYIALGDSIAAGVGSSLPRSRSYPALVHTWLEALNGTTLPYVNLGTPGETAESFVAGAQLVAFQAEVERAATAGLPIMAVTATLGGNELLSARNTGLSNRQAALDEFRGSLAQALDAIRIEIGPNVPLVLTTYYDVTDGDPAQMFTDAWWIAQFNEVIRDGAARVGAHVADLEPLFRGGIAELTLYPVDVHPINQGYRAIAEAVWRALDFDHVAPTVELGSPETAERRTPTLRFTATDAVGITDVVVTLDNAAMTAIEVAPGEYVALLQMDADASDANVTVEVTDSAGNVRRQEQLIRFAATGEDMP